MHNYLNFILLRFSINLNSITMVWSNNLSLLGYSVRNVWSKFNISNNVESLVAGGYFSCKFSHQIFINFSVIFIWCIFRVQFTLEWDNVILSLDQEIFAVSDILDSGFELSFLINYFAFELFNFIFLGCYQLCVVFLSSIFIGS